MGASKVLCAACWEHVSTRTTAVRPASRSATIGAVVHVAMRLRLACTSELEIKLPTSTPGKANRQLLASVGGGGFLNNRA